jgi:D-sedoheptulose 7-phosphate isomerase
MTMTANAPLRYYLERYCLELAAVTVALPFGEVAQIANVLLDCHRRGGTIFVLGNGGSAATASHFACDLAKGARADGVPPFRVMPLTDSVPLLTAWANDTSYEQVFAEQLAALVRADDVVVAISASGNSANVLAAAGVARAVGASIVALSGRCGGKLRALADLTICVPSDTIEQVEDAHIAIAHAVCVALRLVLRERMAGEAPAAMLPRRVARVALAAEPSAKGVDEPVVSPRWGAIRPDGTRATRVAESGRAIGDK